MPHHCLNFTSFGLNVISFSVSSVRTFESRKSHFQLNDWKIIDQEIFQSFNSYIFSILKSLNDGKDRNARRFLQAEV